MASSHTPHLPLSFTGSHHTGCLAVPRTPGVRSPWGLGVGGALCSCLYPSTGPLLLRALLLWHLYKEAFPELPFKLQASHPLHDPNSQSAFSCPSMGPMATSYFRDCGLSHTVGAQQSRAMWTSGGPFSPSSCLGFHGAQSFPGHIGAHWGISFVVSLSLRDIWTPPLSSAPALAVLQRSLQLTAVGGAP